MPTPLPARAFINRLPELPGLAAVVGALQPLVRQSASVSRKRRLGLVAGCLAFPLLAALAFLVATPMLKQAERLQPGLAELSQLLYAQSGHNLPWVQKRTGPEDRLYELYIASHYQSVITNVDQWQSPHALSLIQRANRRFAEQSVAKHPSPTKEEREEAAAAIDPILAALKSGNLIKHPWFPLLAFAAALTIYVAVPALLAALLFRGGLVLRGFRVAIVRRDGTPASRLRLCWRGIVCWAPTLLWPAGFVLLRPVAGISGAAILLLGLVASLALCSVLLKRSLQDRFSGTFLVPR